MKLRHAKKIDYTSTYADFDHVQQFDQNIVDFIRKKEKAEVVIIVDHAYGLVEGHSGAQLVTDHLNFTGENPLVGPNDPVGQRFPVVNHIYLAAADTINQEETWTLGNPLSKLRSGIAAGIRPGQRLSESELALVHKMGAHFYNWNTIPTMIAAAHAGFRVLAIAVPEGVQMDHAIVQSLRR